MELTAEERQQIAAKMAKLEKAIAVLRNYVASVMKKKKPAAKKAR